MRRGAFYSAVDPYGDGRQVVRFEVEPWWKTGSRLASHVMAVVFVHGAPVTSAVWDEVRAAIGHDSSAVSLPGVGRPAP